MLQQSGLSPFEARTPSSAPHKLAAMHDRLTGKMTE